MRTTSREWPGGLRTQILIGLLVLLFVTFGILGVFVDRILSTNVQTTSEERALAAARILLLYPESDLEVLARDFRLLHVRWRDTPTQTQGEWGEANGEPKLTVTRQGRAVDVVVDSQEEQAKLQQWRRLIWSFLFAEALVLLAFAYGFLTFVVIRPIRAIGVATERAGAGDLASPIQLLPRNEFGRVGMSFNQMLERIEEGQRQVQKQLEAISKANRQLQETQQSLVRSEKLASVGQLAAGIAHEVGNPLAAISGYVGLLRDGELDAEEQKDVLERVQKQLDRIREIIRNLLDFSREDASAFSAVSIVACIDDALALIRALPASKGVRLTCETSPDARVYAAQGHLVQVLINLLMNALDAVSESSRGGEILIRVEVADEVEIHVSDNGPGIPEALLHRVFDPFYTTKEPGKGTGLGLAISSRLVEDMRGKLTLESSERGTTFTVHLPLLDESLVG